MGPIDMPLTDVLPSAAAAGESPAQTYDFDAVIAQLEAATRVANANLAYQNAVQMQQALFNVQLAAVGKCAEMILQIDARHPGAKEQLASYEAIMQMLTTQFERMIAKVRVD